MEKTLGEVVVEELQKSTSFRYRNNIREFNACIYYNSNNSIMKII